MWGFRMHPKTIQSLEVAVGATVQKPTLSWKRPMRRLRKSQATEKGQRVYSILFLEAMKKMRESQHLGQAAQLPILTCMSLTEWMAMMKITMVCGSH
jgi:hypothetical protein